jgi:hypothetical protein
MNIHSLYNFFLPHFRKRRKRLFHRLIRLNPTNKILDVGGYHWFWLRMDCSNLVTCLNLDIPHLSESPPAQFTYVQGDGRCLPYRDGEFEIVFSNSVIEHLGTYDNQKRFAMEIQRVGKSYWVQTPNRWFPVEPHLIALLVHYLPKRIQKHLLRWFTPWGLVARPTKTQVVGFLSEVRLLTEKDLRDLFPEAKIHVERFLGLKKSLIAVKTEPMANNRKDTDGE